MLAAVVGSNPTTQSIFINLVDYGIELSWFCWDSSSNYSRKKKELTKKEVDGELEECHQLKLYYYDLYYLSRLNPPVMRLVPFVIRPENSFRSGSKLLSCIIFAYTSSQCL